MCPNWLMARTGFCFFLCVQTGGWRIHVRFSLSYVRSYTMSTSDEEIEGQRDGVEEIEGQRCPHGTRRRTGMWGSQRRERENERFSGEQHQSGQMCMRES